MRSIDMKINAKKKIEKTMFFLDNLGKKHHKTAIVLKIILWLFAPGEMLAFTISKRAYRKFAK